MDVTDEAPPARLAPSLLPSGQALPVLVLLPADDKAAPYAYYSGLAKVQPMMRWVEAHASIKHALRELPHLSEDDVPLYKEQVVERERSRAAVAEHELEQRRKAEKQERVRALLERARRRRGRGRGCATAARSRSMGARPDGELGNRVADVKEFTCSVGMDAFYPGVHRGRWCVRVLGDRKIAKATLSGSRKTKLRRNRNGFGRQHSHSCSAVNPENRRGTCTHLPAVLLRYITISVACFDRHAQHGDIMVDRPPLRFARAKSTSRGERRA